MEFGRQLTNCVAMGGIHSRITRRSLLALPWLLRAQDTIFSTDVKVVNLLASVTNKRGEIVRGLTKDDFVLKDEGHPQSIKYFAQESELPLRLGLLLDVSGSQDSVLDDERRACLRFLDQVIRVNDKAFVLQFAEKAEILAKGALQQALQMAGPDRSRPKRSGGVEGSGTVLYDAIVLAADTVMKRLTGRKALVIISDGVDAASKATLMDAVEAAQRADTVVYSVLFQGRQAFSFAPTPDIKSQNTEDFRPPRYFDPHPGQHRSGRSVLQRISSETAGTCFEVSRRLTLEQVFAAIGEELRNQYSLGFTPERTDSRPEYRRLSLTATPKGLVVRTRKGYYAR